MTLLAKPLYSLRDMRIERERERREEIEHHSILFPLSTRSLCWTSVVYFDYCIPHSLFVQLHHGSNWRCDKNGRPQKINDTRERKMRRRSNSLLLRSLLYLVGENWYSTFFFAQERKKVSFGILSKIGLPQCLRLRVGMPCRAPWIASTSNGMPSTGRENCRLQGRTNSWGLCSTCIAWGTRYATDIGFSRSGRKVAA